MFLSRVFVCVFVERALLIHVCVFVLLIVFKKVGRCKLCVWCVRFVGGFSVRRMALRLDVLRRPLTDSLHRLQARAEVVRGILGEHVDFPALVVEYAEELSCLEARIRVVSLEVGVLHGLSSAFDFSGVPYDAGDEGIVASLLERVVRCLRDGGEDVAAVEEAQVEDDVAACRSACRSEERSLGCLLEAEFASLEAAEAAEVVAGAADSGPGPGPELSLEEVREQGLLTECSRERLKRKGSSQHRSTHLPRKKRPSSSGKVLGVPVEHI